MARLSNADRGPRHSGEPRGETMLMPCLTNRMECDQWQVTFVRRLRTRHRMKANAYSICLLPR